MPTSQERTALIVDDDKMNGQLLSTMVARGGLVPHTASSGQEALQVAAKLVPDIVILDIKMPDMDGYEVCRRLRQDPTTAEVPVILVTASGYQLDPTEVVEAGAQGFLVKPIRINTLLEKLTEYLG
jgi:CheY-like chemotaxis protein